MKEYMDILIYIGEIFIAISAILGVPFYFIKRKQKLQKEHQDYKEAFEQIVQKSNVLADKMSKLITINEIPKVDAISSYHIALTCYIGFYNNLNSFSNKLNNEYKKIIVDDDYTSNEVLPFLRDYGKYHLVYYKNLEIIAEALEIEKPRSFDISTYKGFYAILETHYEYLYNDLRNEWKTLYINI